jgi:hypothetical protein
VNNSSPDAGLTLSSPMSPTTATGSSSAEAGAQLRCSQRYVRRRLRNRALAGEKELTQLKIHATDEPKVLNLSPSDAGKPGRTYVLAETGNEEKHDDILPTTA